MNKSDILNELEKYAASDYVPMHMPGGKRNSDFESTSRLDITEIDGFDNLHNAEGIIKNACDRAAKLYGADRTFFLVNGSTAGVLSAICGATHKNDKVIVARNCHVSVYNALLLARLSPVYVIPEVESETGIYKGVTLEQIRNCIESNRDAAAVIITSPTYEGVVSQVREIAGYLHGLNIPLIVDEAHGAHCRFSEAFPESAVEAGADVVINSIHKTLPALTQTALLHICGRYVDYDRIEMFWNMFQTTSPSYILMGSIDRCMSIIETRGVELFGRYVNMLKELRENIRELKNIRLLDNDDISKVILTCSDGKYLYDRLLGKYKVQPEMKSFRYVIAMTSIADTKDYYARFLKALQEIDRSWKADDGDESADGCGVNDINFNYYPKVMMTPAEALDIMDEKGYEDLCVNSDCLCGKISLSTILIYPPGMPVVNMGERVSAEAIDVIRRAIDSGLEVNGLKEGKVRCLR